MRANKHLDHRGFTVIEIVIAVLVIGGAIVAMAMWFRPSEHHYMKFDHAKRQAGTIKNEMKRLQQSFLLPEFPVMTVGPLPAQCCGDCLKLTSRDLLRFERPLGDSSEFEHDPKTQFSYSSTDGRTATARWITCPRDGGEAEAFVLHARTSAGSHVFDVVLPDSAREAR